VLVEGNGVYSKGQTDKLANMLLDANKKLFKKNKTKIKN
jgi:hypothetical protein